MEKDEIIVAVQEAIQRELGQYKVNKEVHYLDHLWIKEMREWTDSIKSEFWKTIVRTIIRAIIFLTILGFGIWGVKQIGH
ncbi:MAG: hypothetical protein HY096_00320 [Nitrospinae bacterium]|nr:hypothetical protein [Nitrospinota bacterium]